MVDWSERAFDVVTEITKQVLTLATGIIALTLTFFKDFATHASAASKDVLVWAWSIYILSILFGFMTLMASAGVQAAKSEALNVAEASRSPKQAVAAAGSINSSNVRFVGGAQLLSFLVALILTVIAGGLAT